MFDLELAIGAWRRQLAGSEITRPEVLDELDAHLRDEIEQLSRSGLNAEEAFQKAVASLGEPSILKTEFNQSGAGWRCMSPRGFWQRSRDAHAIRASSIVKASALFAALWSVFAFSSTLSAFHLPLGSVFKVGIWCGCAAITAWLVAAWFFGPHRTAQGGMDEFSFAGGLSPFARESLEGARQEAAQFGHDFVGTEHLLLGLLRLNQGAIPRLLKQSGVDVETVRHEVEKMVGSVIRQPTRNLTPITPRARKALKLAGQEARALNQDNLGAEHIFLGLLLERSGVAGLVLTSLNVRAESIRAAIRKGPNQAG